MTSRLSGLLLALSALSASIAQAEENIFMPTSGPACTDRSHSEFGSWRCPGPGGYVAEYSDEGNIAGVSIWMPRQKRKAASAITWRGAGRVFGEKLQWRVDKGRPLAAVLRIWRTDTNSDGQERVVEELIALKVAPEGSCRVASIDARQAGANEIAQRRSDEAASLPCLEDQ
jgi:hypothetical protein